MTLSTRLSLFFLGALAVVLVGFSTALYVLASRHLHRQADERLEAALNTLAAAAEIGPDGVEWEPAERSLSFGRRTVEGLFSWRVSDAEGRRLDGPVWDGPEPPLAGAAGRRSRDVVDRSGATWRVGHRRLEATSPSRIEAPRQAGGAGRAGRHRALVMSAGVSLDGVRATLRNLALVLAALSLGVWTLALAFGRRLCRRALRPVAEMAEAAHAIGGDDLDGRLPAPMTDDELGELGRSFNALLDRLQESFERQRRFTGDASHQLRTPLTAMLGQLDVALRQVRSVEEYGRVLALVQGKARHLRQIVEALLFLARTDTEALQPQLEPIEVADWLTDHLGSWHDPRRAPDVELEIETGGPTWLRVQPALLGELVNNLLDNASKYSEPGTPIAVRLRREGPAVLLSVEDRGLGIAEEDRPHVFEPFYRSPEARRRGSAGLGLGLSVALRLARSFGGTIELASQPGRGSTFTIRFPAEAPAHPAQGAPLRSRRAPTSEGEPTVA